MASMPKQRSLQFTEAMDQQVEALGKFGTRTDIVRIALDRLYREEIGEMNKLQAVRERGERLEARHQNILAIVGRTDWEENADGTVTEPAWYMDYHRADEEMPPYKSDCFTTEEALLAAMRDIEPDLRKWRLVRA